MKYQFIYQNNYLFNIIVYLFISLLIITYYLVWHYIDNNMYRLLLFILLTIIILAWLYFTKKKISKTKGEFLLEKNELAYTSLRKTYYIDYKEIQNISKYYINEDFIILSKQTLCYEIKIKDSGTFKFIAINKSLDEAIKALSKKSKIAILDYTN